MLTQSETQMLQQTRTTKANVRMSVATPVRKPPALTIAMAKPSCPPVTREASECRAPSVHITPRQSEVLALLCQGFSNKLICRTLDLCAGTVKVHVGCILRALGAANRLQALVAAYRLGLVPDADVSAAERGDDARAGNGERRSPRAVEPPHTNRPLMLRAV